MYEIVNKSLIEHIKQNDPYRDPGKIPNNSISTRTLMITAEMDPLREDGEVFARQLAEAGNDVICIRMRGMMHGFMLLWPEFDRCEDVFNKTAAFIRGNIDITL